MDCGMKVYRVEHRRLRNDEDTAFIGPYNTNWHFKLDAWSKTPHDDDSHPTPQEDAKIQKGLEQQGILAWSGEFHCGFTSRQQLRRWFTKEERQKLHKLGYIVATYQSPEVVRGVSQCLFKVPGQLRQVQSLETFI